MNSEPLSNGRKSSFELFIELLKALVWPFITIFLVTCHLSPINKYMEGMPNGAKDSTISSEDISVGANGIKMSFKRAAYEEARKIIDATDTVASKPVPPTKLADVNVVPKDIIHDVKVLEATAPQEVTQSWVYIGQRAGDKWLSNNFDIAGIPKVNAVLTANTAVYKRDADPQPTPTVDWKLGKIIGVIEQGKSVKLLTVKEISEGNWWAEVSDSIRK